MLTHLSYQLSSLLPGAKKSSFCTGYKVVAPILIDGDNVVLNVHSYKLTDESLKSLRLYSIISHFLFCLHSHIAVEHVKLLYMWKRSGRFGYIRYTNGRHTRSSAQ